MWKNLTIIIAASFIVLISGSGISAHAQGFAEKWVASGSSLPSNLIISQPFITTDSSAEAPAPSAETSVKARFNMGTAHKYLGYSTLFFAVGAAVSSSSEDVHKTLGYTAAGLATLTCVTGYLEYGDYFNLDDGWSTTNIHIVSGAAATVGFIITAALGSNDRSHGGIGGASTVLMTVPVIALKW
jgi:hypothetical protein